MDKKEIFINALNTYISRNGDELTQQDIEPLIMNLAYLDVYNARKNKKSVNEFEVLISYSWVAKQLIPTLDFEAHTYAFGFQATLEWDGLWEFLQDFFQRKLGWNIDENDEVDVERFDSSSHTREEIIALLLSMTVLIQLRNLFWTYYQEV